MKKITLFVVICFCSIHMIQAQINSFVREGFQFRILEQSVNISNDIVSNGNGFSGTKYVAHLNDGTGIGASIGYRFHSKAPVDCSIDLSYLSSKHTIDYQYQYPQSVNIDNVDVPIVFPSSLLSGQDNRPINQITPHILCIDLNVYFMNKKRIQPYFNFGSEIYLNKFHIRGIPYDLPYKMGKAISYVTYTFDKSYSIYNFHAGGGVSCYIAKYMSINLFVHSSLSEFNLSGVQTELCDSFPKLSIEYGSSFSYIF